MPRALRLELQASERSKGLDIERSKGLERHLIYAARVMHHWSLGSLITIQQPRRV